MFDNKDLLNPHLEELLDRSASEVLSLMRDADSSWKWKLAVKEAGGVAGHGWSTAEIILYAWELSAEKRSRSYPGGLYTYAAALHGLASAAGDAGYISDVVATARMDTARQLASAAVWRSADERKGEHPDG